jgi:hypothetical protein
VVGITYTASDRYCLDGQRLLALNGGTDGANGTEYRTEQDGYSKVISYTEVGATNGPGSFIVKTRTGLTMEFGNPAVAQTTANARVFAGGKSVVAVWALNKVSDAKGNYMIVNYSASDAAYGQYYPVSISYTGNAAASIQPRQLVNFSYALNAQGQSTRSDPISGFVAGSEFRTTALLTGISVQSNSTTVKNYNLTYQQSPNTQQSRLTQVQECISNNTTCKPPLTFAWDANAAPTMIGSRGETRAGGYIPGGTNEWWLPGDANGDGLTDLFHVFNENGQISVDVHVNQGNGTLLASRWATNVGGFMGLDKILIADVNGDGRADLIHIFAENGNASVDFIINKPSNLLQNVVRAETQAGGYWAMQNWQVADLNGDGLPDLVNIFSSAYDAAGNPTGYIIIDAHVNQGVNTLSKARWATNVGGYIGLDKFFVADFNGDGRADVVHVFNDNGAASVDFIVNKPSNLLQNVVRAETQAGGYWAMQNWQMADVNGDGLPDLVNIFSSTYDASGNPTGYIDVEAHVNQGNNSLRSARWATNAGGYLTLDQFFVVDMNGDGRADILHLFNDRGQASIDAIVSDGLSYQHVQRLQTQGGGLWSTQIWMPMDIYGKGLSGLLNLFADNNQADVDFHALQNPAGDHIVSINSLGGALPVDAAITYQTLPQAALSSRYSASLQPTYPQQLITSPIFLVTDLASSNGMGGIRTTNYSYGNLLASGGLQGRGSSGFQWTQSQDASTGLASRTCYRQDWPYVGLVDKVMTATSSASLLACNASVGYNNLAPLTASGSGLLSLTLNAYKFNAYPSSDSAYASPVTCVDDPATGKTSASCPASATAAGSRYQAYVFQSLAQSRDWDGATFIALPATRTTMTQDNLGNATQVKAETLNADGTTVSGYSKTTTSTYMAPDMTNWLLGRLQRSSVQAVSP